jgi:transposase
MKLHGNAALSLKKRELLVSRVADEKWSLTKAAAAAEVSERTAGKWVRRFAADGPAGLLDRSSAPKHVHNRTDERRIQVIAALRRLRMTGAEIAEVLRMPHTTVAGLLKKIGMGKLGRLGLEPAQRYQRKRPGELVHVDVKKLGRIEGGAGKRWRERPKQHYNPTTGGRSQPRKRTVGWEFVHVAVDDATRLAYVEVLADEKAKIAIAFLAAPFASSAATASGSSAC